jgi:hypothetical protein
MRLYRRLCGESHPRARWFTLRYRLGVTHDLYFIGDEAAIPTGARR